MTPEEVITAESILLALGVTGIGLFIGGLLMGGLWHLLRTFIFKRK